MSDSWGTSDDWGSSATSSGGDKAKADSGWGSTDTGSGWGSTDTGSGSGRPNNRGSDSRPPRGRNNSKPAWASGDAGSRKPNNNQASDWGSSKADSDWGQSGTRSGGDSSNAKSGWGSDDKESGWGSTDAGSGWNSESQPQGDRKRFKREGGDNNWGRNEDNNNRGRREDRENNRQKDDGDNQDEKEDRPAPYKPDELNADEEAQLYGNEAGANFDHYSEHKVVCIPAVVPVEKFEDVVASQLLLGNLKRQNYLQMTPIQKWAMPSIMEGYDIIACAPTGSGKTAAFLLPILQALLNSDLEPNDPNSDCQSPSCLIISPTRELANQIYVHANMLSRDSIIKCLVIYGQISTIHLKTRLSMGCHVLVATPGRLKDFVQRGWIDFKNIKYVILDEGDRLIDDGFSSDIENIFNHETMPSKESRQTLFFSATFRDQTQLSAKKYVKEDKFVFLTVGRVGAANFDIKQEFLKVGRQEKKRELKKILESIPEEDKTIIFTQTKIAADMLAGFFSALNLSSTSIHGDRHQSQREQAIKSFRKGEKRFLISSPVGNRGLDLPKVSLVINYDLPSNIDEYVHRIGRTGRAGHSGRALSFYDEDRDQEILPDLIQILNEAKQEVPEWMNPSGGSSGQISSDFGEIKESAETVDNKETVTGGNSWGDDAW